MFFRFRRQPRPATTRRPVAYRPRLEGLEDRCLLNAGALDPTFNPNGTLPGTLTNPAQGEGTAVLVQPSGNLVVAGYNQNSDGQAQMSVACYLPDGAPDTQFGSGGTFVPSFKGVSSSAGSDAVLYPSGSTGDEQILEVGTAIVSGKKYATALVRYNDNGTLDTNFGNGGRSSPPSRKAA
jgi:uncharacterized delta-60 repeat protein